MADLFNRVANDPVSLGLVNGLFESIIAGKSEERKRKIVAAEKAAEKQKSGIDTFVATATKNPENAYNVMTSPAHRPYLKFLMKENPHALQAISLAALGDRGFPEYVKTILESSRGSSTFAMNAIENNGANLKATYPKAFNILKTYASMNSLNEGENRILGNIKNKAQANSYIERVFPVVETVEKIQGPVSATLTGDGNKDLDEAVGGQRSSYNIRGGGANKSALFWTLEGIANAKEETSGPNIDDIKKVLDASDDKDKLAALNYMEDKLPFETVDNVKVYSNPKAHFFIQAVKQSYGSSKSGADSEVWRTSIDQAFNLVSGSDALKSETERGLSASTFLPKFNIAEIKKLENKKDKTEDDVELLNKFYLIKDMADKFNKADKKAGASDFTFTSTLKGEPVTRDLMPTGLDGKSMLTAKGSLAFLNKLNSTEDFEAFYTGLPDDKKLMLAGAVTKAFQLVHEDKIAKTSQTIFQGSDTKAVNEPAYNFFNTAFSNNLSKIPFVETFITNTLGLPKTSENNAVNPLPLDNQNNVPENSVRLNGTVYKLAPETIEFAKNNGYANNPRGLFRDISYPLMRNSGYENQNEEIVNADKNITVAHKIQKAGLVHPSAVPTSKQVRSIARVLINNKIEDAGEMFQVIKMAQSPDISHLLPESKPYEVGLSAKELNRVMFELTDFKYDLKGVTKQANANEQFLQFLRAAKTTIGDRGTDTPDFLNNLYSAGVKLFLIEGSVFDASKNNFTKMIGGMIGHDGDTDAQIALQTKNIEDEVENFRRVNFGMKNDQLASIYISLAYNYAKTLDPSGRISDADFKAAMNAIKGSMLNTQTMSLGILDFFESKAEVDSVFLRNVSKGMLRLEQGNFIIDKDTIRNLKAVRVFRDVRLIQSNFEQVRDYQKMFDKSGGGFMGARNNVGNAKFRDRYEPKLILDGTFPENPPTYMIRFKGGLGEQVGGSQVPLYVNQEGRILTVREIQQLKNAPRES